MALRLRRKSSEITRPRLFSVTYLGYITLASETEAKNSKGNIDAIVKDANTKLQDLKKMKLTITEEELILIDPKSKTESAFATEKIYCCSAEDGKEPIFSFVYSMPDSPSRFECHAVLCSGEETAGKIASSLNTSFRGNVLKATKERNKKDRARELGIRQINPL